MRPAYLIQFTVKGIWRTMDHEFRGRARAISFAKLEASKKPEADFRVLKTILPPIYKQQRSLDWNATRA